MIDEKYIDLVTSYLEGSLTSDERFRLQQLVDEGKIDIIDLKEMEQVYTRLDSLPVSEPSEKLRHRFYDFLETEKQRQSYSGLTNIFDRLKEYIVSPVMRKTVMATAIFLIGMLAGNLFTPFRDYRQQMNRLSSEVSQIREVMMLSLLDAPSASERLKAVNISTGISGADERVITALLKTLNSDPNVNVRLASIEALLQHAVNPIVRQGLVESISIQESPQVQVALADAMLALQETNAVDELRRILEQDELDGTVRDKLTNTIAALNQRVKS